MNFIGVTRAIFFLGIVRLGAVWEERGGGEGWEERVKFPTRLADPPFLPFPPLQLAGGPKAMWSMQIVSMFLMWSKSTGFQV